jgi:hypothetical protein
MKTNKMHNRQNRKKKIEFQLKKMGLYFFETLQKFSSDTIFQNRDCGTEISHNRESINTIECHFSP